MNKQFQPRFPRAVSGENYRVPFKIPRVEKLSKRMSHIYETVELHHDDRARLLGLHARLLKAHMCLGINANDDELLLQAATEFDEFLTRLALDEDI